MIVFDNAILRPGALSFDLVGTSVESGRSMSGITGAIDYSAGGMWSVEYKNIFIETRDQHRYWSYLRNNLSGGVKNIDVKVDQHGSAPVAGSTEFESSSFDGSYAFSDGSAFRAGTVTAFISGSFSTGDGTISINIVEGGELIGGESFSVYHSTKGWRIYSITSVDSVSGTTYTVGIKPPLRGTMTSGDVCEFLEPKCRMRLMPGTKIPMEAKPPWHNPNASISFIETFND